MQKSKHFNTIILYSLVQKIYNSLIAVIVEDVLGNLVELIYSFLLVKREDYDSLGKYLEATEYYFC